nr:MAG TPA: Frataxin [Caudoviricetes sp.]
MTLPQYIIGSPAKAGSHKFTWEDIKWVMTI